MRGVQIESITHALYARWMIVAIVASSVVSCATTRARPIADPDVERSRDARPIADPDVERSRELALAAEHLDYVEKYVAEWGTGAISEIVLLKNEGQFDIEYKQPTGDYVEKARTGNQGAVRRSFERSIDVQAAQTSSVDADAVAAAVATGGAGAAVAGTAGAAASAGGDNATSAPQITSALPQTNPAAQVLSSQKFSAPLEIGDLPAAISERSALLIGASDKLTERILSFLSNPQLTDKNKKIYLGILQVSVNPGWRTRRGYIADVHVNLEYAPDADANADAVTDADTNADADADTEADTEVKPEIKPGDWSIDRYYKDPDSHGAGVGPAVISVFPLLEAQTLDLRNSERRQFAFVMYLATVLTAAGQSEQAEQLISAAQRTEFDVATRSPIPVVSSYTNGYSFGFQFQPRLQALGQPANMNSSTENILQPYSFPALIVVVVDQEDLKLTKDGSKSYTHLGATISTSWVPLRHDVPRRQRLGLHSNRTELQAGVAAELDRAILKIYSGKDDTRTTNQRNEELQRRLRQLNHLGIGLSTMTRLPLEPPPVTPQPGKDPEAPLIDTVLPVQGYINAPTTIVVTGENFKNGQKEQVQRVIVGGVDCNFTIVSSKALVVVVPAWTNAPASEIDSSRIKELGVESKVTIVTSLNTLTSTGTVKFDRVRLSEPAPGPAITIQYDANGRPATITLAPEAVGGGSGGKLSGETLLDQLTKILTETSQRVSLDNVEVTLKKP